MKKIKIYSLVAICSCLIFSHQLVAQLTISNRMLEKNMIVRRNTAIGSKNYVKQETKSLGKTISQETHVILKAKNDTIFYYYNSGGISVIEAPMQNSHRRIFLFDKKGNKTYEFEEVRLASGSISVSFRYAIDGAVSSAHIHQNPMASKYVSETDITFKDENYPSWKIENKTPPESVLIPKKYYWGGHQWVAQQLIKERDIPVLK